MRRNSVLAFLKEKSFLIVLTLMLVSAGTMALMFSLGGDDQAKDSEIAQQEEVAETIPSANEYDTTENAPEETAELSMETQISRIELMERQTEASAANSENALLEAELEDQYLEAEETAEAAAADVVAEGFQEASAPVLQWPVQGEVIMEFSMDHSVYFETLAQYQYNPAMIIGAAEGTEVLCGAAGTVIEVGSTNEYGNFVTMDLGDGFMITYGQLSDVTTEAGEVLETGDRMGAVAKPTRSFSEEGGNLYLKLTQDGTAVDPALYLEKK